MLKPLDFTNPQPDGEAAIKPYPELRRERRLALECELAPIISASRPLVWEVGCGHGHFLAAYAQAHPSTLCIGIDIAGDRIARATRKRDRARLTQLHFIRAEAGQFLEALPVTAQFSDVFILFPDPWPKLRHHKHRIMQPEFLQLLSVKMGEGARLFFRTDYRPYFDETALLLMRLPEWRLVDQPWPFEHATVFQNRALSHDSLVAQIRKPGA